MNNVHVMNTYYALVYLRKSNLASCHKPSEHNLVIID